MFILFLPTCLFSPFNFRFGSDSHSTFLSMNVGFVSNKMSQIYLLFIYRKIIIFLVLYNIECTNNPWSSILFISIDGEHTDMEADRQAFPAKHSHNISFIILYTSLTRNFHCSWLCRSYGLTHATYPSYIFLRLMKYNLDMETSEMRIRRDVWIKNDKELFCNRLKNSSDL